MLDTGEPWIGTRHDFGSRRRARRVGKTMGKHHSVFYQFVDMWRPDTMAAICVERFDPEVISKNQDNAWSVALQATGLGLLLLSPKCFFPVPMLCLEFLEAAVLFD